MRLEQAEALAKEEGGEVFSVQFSSRESLGEDVRVALEECEAASGCGFKFGVQERNGLPLLAAYQDIGGKIYEHAAWASRPVDGLTFVSMAGKRLVEDIARQRGLPING